MDIRQCFSKLALSTMALLLAPSMPSSAAEFFVTAVIREVPLSSQEVSFKDVYINAGTNNGLKKGAFVETIRRLPAYDNVNSKVSGDMQVRIAKLRLIHVEKNASVARLVKFYEKETTPITGNDSVMIGDLVEVAEKQTP